MHQESKTASKFKEVMFRGSDNDGWRWEVTFNDNTKSGGNVSNFEEARKRAKEAINAGF